jgi:hypothetical protein
VTLHTLRHSDLGYAEARLRRGDRRYTHVLDAVLVAAADQVATTVQGYMTGEFGEQKER